MCGIVGAVAERDVVPILLEGLRRLEYRGYDSAGVAVLDGAGLIERLRTIGKVTGLVQAVTANQLHGRIGIAHTRWATHGQPNERNAHPHLCRDAVAVVHNGIIENHDELRQGQLAAGYEFASDTDTEVIAHQLHRYLSDGLDLYTALRHTVHDLRGAYAVAAIAKEQPERIVVARSGAPLVIGIGIGEHFVASDVAALLPVTRRFIFLEEGDVADITREGVTIYDHHGSAVERPIRESELNADAVERGEYRHYMLKEIYEQPRAIAETLEGRIGHGRVFEEAFGPAAKAALDATRRIYIVACGTSWHAGLVARYWFEAVAGIPCTVEVASEFRYRQVVVEPATLLIAISQSGETADTLAALRQAKRSGFAHTLAVCNVPESSLVREADLTLMTRAGPEIGVASTKAFTTQLVALMLVVLAVGRRHRTSAEQEAELVNQLATLPRRVEQVLLLDPLINETAAAFADKHHTLFLGRGPHYPIALEGALKLKEISYIHAEAYPAGELKHGPLALVDSEMPVVAVAPNNALLEKLRSNLEEVRARGGQLYVFADDGVPLVSEPGLHVMDVGHVEAGISAILYTIPLQLLAYHVAVLKGTDVDQPRNLAKSVTVE